MIADPLMEHIADPTRSPEQLGKNHLNSNIGGFTSKIKVHREGDVGNTSKFAKKKKLLQIRVLVSLTLQIRLFNFGLTPTKAMQQPNQFKNQYVHKDLASAINKDIY